MQRYQRKQRRTLDAHIVIAAQHPVVVGVKQTWDGRIKAVLAMAEAGQIYVIERVEDPNGTHQEFSLWDRKDFQSEFQPQHEDEDQYIVPRRSANATRPLSDQRAFPPRHDQTVEVPIPAYLQQPDPFLGS